LAKIKRKNESVTVVLILFGLKKMKVDYVSGSVKYWIGLDYNQQIWQQAKK
jgi:hypothetical protein